MFKDTLPSVRPALTAVLTVLCVGIVFADMMPPEGYHWVVKRAFFSKAESAGDLVLVGQIVLGGERKRYVISDDTPCSLSYKLNIFRLWALDSGYFNATPFANIPLIPDSSDHQQRWLITDTNGYPYPNLGWYVGPDSGSPLIYSTSDYYTVSGGRRASDVQCTWTRTVGFDSSGHVTWDTNSVGIQSFVLNAPVANSLTIFPNSFGMRFVSTRVQEVTVSLVNVRGQSMMRSQIRCGPMVRNDISLSHLPAGVYIAEVRSKTQRVSGKICLMR